MSRVRGPREKSASDTLSGGILTVATATERNYMPAAHYGHRSNEAHTLAFAAFDGIPSLDVSQIDLPLLPFRVFFDNLSVNSPNISDNLCVNTRSRTSC